MSQHRPNKKDITHPRVLFLHFEEQEGSWSVRVPNAYGKGKDFVAPISEELSMQFQPVKMTNITTAEQSVGVGCVPLMEMPDEEAEKDAV